MILTRAELATLTGCKTRSGQIRVLTANGVRFIVAADGWPRVLESAVIQAAGEAVVALPKRHEREPNFDAIQRAR